MRKEAKAMIEPAAFCCMSPPILTEWEAKEKLALHIDGYPDEEFKFIDYEDIVKNRYFVTSYGRIFLNNGKELFPVLLVPNKAPDKVYLSIGLTCTTYRKNRRFLVHRLVATAFVPKTPEDILLGRDFVNHKYNMDGRCNYAWNLEWTTIKENSYHALNYAEGCYDPYYFDISHIIYRKEQFGNQPRIGTQVSGAKLSEHQVHLVCMAYTQLGYTVNECTQYAWLELTKNNIEIVRDIVKGKTWKHISSLYGIQPTEEGQKMHSSNYRPNKFDEYNKVVEGRNILRKIVDVQRLV